MSFEPKKSYGLVNDVINRYDIQDLCRWLRGDKPDVEPQNDFEIEQWTTPWLTQGPLVKQFEEAFAKKVGAAHAIFVNSGSSANTLAWAFPIAVSRDEMAKNPRVAVPAASWATTVGQTIWMGYAPALCEADEDTWGMDPAALRRICENSDKGPPSMVMVVHQLGVPAKTEEIGKLKEEFDFILIEDACGAFGSSPVGQVGELWTYSTFFGHQLSTIEGGFICTNSDEAANILRMLRAHGWAADLDRAMQEKLAAAEKIEPFREKFTFYLPPLGNFRNTDLHAHLGLSGLKRADEVAAARYRNWETYRERFADSKDFKVQWQKGAPADVFPAAIGYGVLASSKAHRAKVAEALKARGIDTRPVGGGNMGRQPFWVNAMGELKTPRPFADRIHNHGFQLPCHPGLTAEDVGYIADTVLSVKP